MTDSDADPWVVRVAPQRQSTTHYSNGAAVPFLDIETSGPIVPLDQQFGVLSKKTVPDALRSVLFGSVLFGHMDDATLQSEGISFDRTEPRQLGTYAILDAAKIVNLPLLLENIGLPNRCLFKGKAVEDLGHVARFTTV